MNFKNSESSKYWYNKLSNRFSSSSFSSEGATLNANDRLKKFKHTLSEEQAKEIDRVTGKSEFLRFVIFMTAVKLSLFILNNKNHIIVGTPPHKNMGPEKNSADDIVPIINEIDLELNGTDLLMNIRKSLVDSYHHQDYPNAHLAQDLNLKENELGQIVELLLAHTDFHDEITNLNIFSIVINDFNNQILGEINFNSRQISEEEIDNLFCSIFVVLEVLVFNLKSSVSEIILKSKTILKNDDEVIKIQQELIKHPTILNAFVRKVGADKHFVAYLVGKPSMLRSNKLIEKFLEYNLDNFTAKMEFVWMKNQEELEVSLNQIATEVNGPKIDMPQSDVEKSIHRIWVEILKLEDIGVNSNFFEIGGDSILSIEVLSKMKKVGLHITPKDILAYPTIKQLSQKVKKAPYQLKEIVGSSKKVSITPTQHWFFSQNFTNGNHYNSARLYTLNVPVDYPKIEQAYKLLTKHHDALRTRFANDGTSWSQTISDEYVPCSLIDISNLNEKKQTESIELTARKYQRNINITKGPLFSLIVFYLGDNKPGRLLMISHKLITDGLSMRILEEDFQSIYSSLLNNEEPKLPEKTTSYKMWSQTLSQYTHSSDIEKELSYWTEKKFLDAYRFPVDFDEADNIEKSTETIYASLSEENTLKMIKLARSKYQSKISAILFSSFLVTMYQWNGVKSIVFDSGGHGREYIQDNMDLSRTVGAFYNVFPVFLELDEGLDVKLVPESVLNQISNIPNNGMGFGLLKYLHKDKQVRSKLSSIPTPSIAFDFQGIFNYLDTYEETTILGKADENYGSLSDSDNSRVYEFDISSWISENKYIVRWKYSAERVERSTVNSLINLYFDNISKLIN